MNFNELFSIRFISICIIALLLTYGVSQFLYNDLTEAPAKINSETEIALIFFGCSTCPAATMDEIPNILNTLSEKVQNAALTNGHNYSFIGISKENNIKQGLEYLTNIAPFHEISLGKNMQNTAIQKYVWETFDNPLSASTPQVIISKRLYETNTADNDSTVLPIIASEEILIRKIGIEQFIQLSKQENFFNSF
jgi:hypothetical protein